MSVINKTFKERTHEFGTFIDEYGQLIQWVCILDEDFQLDFEKEDGWINQASVGQPKCYHRIVPIDYPIVGTIPYDTGQIV